MRGSTFKYDTKRGDRWGYVFPNPHGTPKQIRRGGFATRKAATAAMQAQLVARREADYIEPTAMPLAVYLQDWLADVAPSIAPSTLHNYTDHVDHLSGELGAIPLGRLSPPAITDAYRALGTRLAPSTLRITHNVLRGALMQAVRWRLIRDNPADIVTLPALTVEGEIVWSAEEANRFLVKTASDPHHALWRLLLSTGMRLGEALALSWGALDLDGGQVAVVRTVSKDADERLTIVERTKTSAGRRTLDLDTAAITALRQHRVRQVEWRLQASHWHDAGLVFAGRYGQITQGQTVRRRLQSACKTAGVTVITPKAMRHTAATLMVANGVPLHAVKNVLGHANITLTANLYAHVSPEAGRQAVAVLARVLEG